MKLLTFLAFAPLVLAACAHKPSEPARHVASSVDPAQVVRAALRLFGGDVSNFNTNGAKGITPLNEACRVNYSAQSRTSPAFFDVIVRTGDVHKPAGQINLSESPIHPTEIIAFTQGDSSFDLTFRVKQPPNKTDFGWSFGSDTWVTYRLALEFQGHTLKAVTGGQIESEAAAPGDVPVLRCEFR